MFLHSILFQTLPGIIPRFYLVRLSVESVESEFQTLPGIIPRFYTGTCRPVNPRFRRFQTLPGIIPRFYVFWVDFLPNFIICFKPFQGLFRVSTVGYQLYPGDKPNRFKPFQGLFRVSTCLWR
ncbi:hypothetical protein U27_01542 [Candidatus Vecturithrix granuli]|uniref:Uncharacterized protein n=1 Tax=Vecturithrix granuli TaxID=1499967 RepID=A0A081CAN6_VECG1|nr:hypothetical protein U27_01542 [Candidatus Vecturithrix granuli]